MEISRLQEIFTEKVLTQSEQIFELHRTAVETTGISRAMFLHYMLTILMSRSNFYHSKVYIQPWKSNATDCKNLRNLLGYGMKWPAILKSYCLNLNLNLNTCASFINLNSGKVSLLGKDWYKMNTV